VRAFLQEKNLCADRLQTLQLRCAARAFIFVTHTYKVRVLVAAQQGSKQAKNAPTLNFPRKHREVEGWSVFCLFASFQVIW